MLTVAVAEDENVRNESDTISERLIVISPRLFRYLRSVLRNEEDAEDALGQTYLEIWRLRGDAPEEDDALAAWAFAVSRNVARNQLRTRQRRLRLHQKLRDLTPPASLEEPPHAEFRSDDLARAVRLLPEIDQAIVFLVFVEDMDHESASRILNLKPSTLRSRILRIRRFIKRKLETDDL